MLDCLLVFLFVCLLISSMAAIAEIPPAIPTEAPLLLFAAIIFKDEFVERNRGWNVTLVRHSSLEKLFHE